jgi:hypothetical protein
MIAMDPMERARVRLAVREAVRRHVLDANVGLIDFGWRLRDGRLTLPGGISISDEHRNAHGTIGALVAVPVTSTDLPDGGDARFADRCTALHSPGTRGDWFTLDKAREARERLVAQLVRHPDFMLVDITSREGSGDPIVRVHLRGGETSAQKVPTEIAGIPVEVVRADLHSE